MKQVITAIAIILAIAGHAFAGDNIKVSQLNSGRPIMNVGKGEVLVNKYQDPENGVVCYVTTYTFLESVSQHRNTSISTSCVNLATK